MRFILHIKNTPNNYIYNITDYQGNTLYFCTAKKLKYKSKQVRSTIVIQNIWNNIIENLQKQNCLNLTINMSGPTFFKKDFFQQLVLKGFIITSIDLKIPVPFNGCKPRHFRRV